MAKRPDPNEIRYVYIRQVGGEVGASSVLSPKLGPLGLSPKKIGDDIAKETQSWKGLKICVKLTIQNRQAKIEVVPTSASMVLKELNEAPRDRKKVKNIKHNGNLKIEQVYSIARAMQEKSRAKEFKGTVKEILGTCNSIGCTVDGKKPTTIQEMIDNGDIDVPDN
ncbi:60S ribosomal protein L12, putative [Plasmodium vinckei brucechwatti]|uniref:60S ribosomal protein L12, putative n=1 Tax=Plasmodium vinckei brucechwatti TaxID=119398 RepID=A0A6V7SIK5_PLAVN|nr:60S ribosomal protein L12, putative [Plasmodium vinckei brucechwatti]